MKDPEEIENYFKAIATANKLVGHTVDEKHFATVELGTFENDLVESMKMPAIGLHEITYVTTGSHSKNTLFFSFCGKSQHEVRKLIAGPTVFICDECVELCMDIIREEEQAGGPLAQERDGIPTPKEIKEKGISNAKNQLTVYCSDTTHTWVEKAVILFGLGTEAIRWIPSDDENKMRIDLLEKSISEDVKNDCIPMIIIGTAGDVSTGSVDNL